VRYKIMSIEEFKQIVSRNWVPVQYSESNWPTWMKNIPSHKVELVLASGTFIDPRTVLVEGVTISGAVGGMDIYRHDPNDAPQGFPINKDHYVLMVDPDSGACLLVAGPYKDNEHWLSELPELPPGITVIDPNGSDES